MKKVLLSLIVVALVACAIDPYSGEKKVSNTAKGGLIGVAGGAAIGALSARKGKKNEGALIGALAGGATGAAVGGYMDLQARALREELEGTGVRVVQNGEEVDLIMPGNITFATDSATLTSSVKPVLNSVGKVLVKYNKTFAAITGYTDNTGNVAYNNTLSFNRANAVANYLKTRGVSGDRMLVEGHGLKNPIASNSTAGGREQNRRVEIHLTQAE